MNIFKLLKDWWDNNKNVIKNFVIPKLDLAQGALVTFIVSKGILPAQAEILGKEIIGWLKDYLNRQV